MAITQAGDEREQEAIDREDAEVACLVERIQAGEQAAFKELYVRYFDRVHTYLRLLLADPHEAEDLSQQIFLNLFQRISSYERRDVPFRAWLFIVVRNEALKHLRKHRPVELEENGVLNRVRDEAGAADADLIALGWVTDQDLTIFIRRLPLAQRQVLLLRYVLDLGFDQVAEVLERTTSDVRLLHHRALSFLRARLAAIGRDPKGRGRMRTRSCDRQAPVLRSRRFALLD